MGYFYQQLLVDLEAKLTERADGSGKVPVPASESIEQRLRQYRLDRFVTTVGSLSPTHEDIYFNPARDDVKQYYVEVPVESLDDLKLWTGIPNDQIDHAKYRSHLKMVRVPTLTSVVGREILKVVAPEDIAAAEFNLLFGHVNDELLRNDFWMAVAHGLLERMTSIHVLVLEELIVHDGQTVTVSNTPTAFFGNLITQGTGLVKFLCDCKLIVGPGSNRRET
jgi:hypothetical protein